MKSELVTNCLDFVGKKYQPEIYQINWVVTQFQEPYSDQGVKWINKQHSLNVSKTIVLEKFKFIKQHAKMRCRV